ncbi:MAG: hypothetical protein ACUVXI_18055 [bacterium]
MYNQKLQMRVLNELYSSYEKYGNEMVNTQQLSNRLGVHWMDLDRCLEDLERGGYVRILGLSVAALTQEGKEFVMGIRGGYGKIRARGPEELEVEYELNRVREEIEKMKDPDGKKEALEALDAVIAECTKPKRRIDLRLLRRKLKVIDSLAGPEVCDMAVNAINNYIS